MKQSIIVAVVFFSAVTLGNYKKKIEILFHFLRFFHCVVESFWSTFNFNWDTRYNRVIENKSEQKVVAMKINRFFLHLRVDKLYSATWFIYLLHWEKKLQMLGPFEIIIFSQSMQPAIFQIDRLFYLKVKKKEIRGNLLKKRLFFFS